MPLDEILFCDTERKTLPFRQAARCKVKTISSWKQFEAVMKAGSGLLDFKANEQDKADYYNPIKVVVVDSFTRILYLLSEFLKQNKVTGYDYWREYSDILEQLLMTWQSKGRFIIFTALDEIVRDNDSIDRIVVKVDGKKLEGKIESFFTIVLHTHFNPLKQGAEAYQFCTNTDGRNTAKLPDGMFAERYIQNDMSLVLGAIYDYYDMANNPDFTPSPILVCGKSGSGKSTSVKYLFEDS
jgi:hypothetical protein